MLKFTAIFIKNNMSNSRVQTLGSNVEADLGPESLDPIVWLIIPEEINKGFEYCDNMINLNFKTVSNSWVQTLGSKLIYNVGPESLTQFVVFIDHIIYNNQNIC